MLAASPSRASSRAGVTVCNAGRTNMRVMCKAEATKTTTTTKKASTKSSKDNELGGFRYDGTMMRWVRDDRFGAMDNVVIETKTGSAYTVWPVVHRQLTAKNIKSVTPQEALKMQKQGWTIVDVRIDGDYDKEHAEGAVNIPLFRFVQGDQFWDKVKKVVMASFAMKATERDPDYAGTVAKTLKPGQKIILCCAIGGTLTVGVRLRPDKYPDGVDDPDRNFGRESRSLKAAYELVQAGWNSSNLVYMDGGFQQWRYQKLPTEQGRD